MKFGRFSVRALPGNTVAEIVKLLESHNMHIQKRPDEDRGSGMPIGDSIYIVAGYKKALEEAFLDEMKLDYYLELE